MFAAGRKAAASSSSPSADTRAEDDDRQQTDDDWLNVGKSFSSGTIGDKSKHLAADSSESALQVYRHRHSKRRHKEKWKHKEKEATAVTSRGSRHVSKHKKKSKDKKRRRSRSRSDTESSGDGRSAHRSRRRRRRHSKSRSRSRSRSRGHHDENQLVTQTTKDIVVHGDTDDGEDKLFEFDSVGDRDNQFFGSTYVHDQPLYELATRRNLMTGDWISKKRSAYTATLPFESEERNSDRYFSLQARKAEKDARQKRLYLAYSEKRLTRAPANDDVVHSRDRQVSSHPPEMAFIPLDPVVTLTELREDSLSGGQSYGIAGRDGETGVLLTDGQSVEQYIVERNRALNAAVAANPQDADVWLDLMAFQEHTMRLHTKTKSMRSAMQASVEEKQAAILARALAKNPQSRELHRVKLNMSLRSQLSSRGDADIDSFHQQLEGFLAEDIANDELWVKLIQNRQQRFGTFSMQSVRDVYARILSVMRAEYENAVKEEMTSANSPISTITMNEKTGERRRGSSLEKFSCLLLDFHFLMCTFEKKAGFAERSIAHAQALIDFALRDGPGKRDSPGIHLDLLQEFAARWNDESTVGFGDEGWKHFAVTDFTFEIDPPHLPVDEFNEYVRTTCVTTLDQVNPPQVLRTNEHKRNLLLASAKYKRKSRLNGNAISEIAGQGNNNQESASINREEDEDLATESKTGSKFIYSNLHGYRISVDDADDTKEYERILGELRGTETARARQNQLFEKEKMKRVLLEATELELEDQRANYDPVEDSDRFVGWLAHEEVQTELQWTPLRSNNPLHQNLIEQQPDRTILTEELQPFVFPVSVANRWRLVSGLLNTCGVEWRGEYQWNHTSRAFESMYADDVKDCELLTSPILAVLDPQSPRSKNQTLFLTPDKRKILLQSALIEDIAVKRGTLHDPSKVAFVRRAFMQALSVFSNIDKDFASTLKCLRISFEAEVISTVGDDDDKHLTYARRLSQHLAQNDANGTDFNVLYAYAKLELKVGNERQVRRICESTLASIGIPLQSDFNTMKSLHRFVFLRARLEMWPSTDAGNEDKVAMTRDQERLRLLRCLYTLWSVWRSDSSDIESLDAISKRYRKRAWIALEEKLMSDPSIEAQLIARYHTELDIAIHHCVECTAKGNGDCIIDGSQARSTCWAGYCLHNLALVVYAYRGFEAACNEYRQALAKVKNHNCSNLAWMWTCFLDFMQQHQASGFFPAVAPRAWRSSVSQAVEKFPHNVLFLRLFVDSETSNTISQVLRNYFFRVEKRWQRHYDSPELVEWLFALLCEICRVERAATIMTAMENADEASRPTCCLFHRWGMNATAAGRIRHTFESMVNHIRTKGNALCWRLYMHFELALGKVDAAKKVLYRSIAACAWSKALYMDGLRTLRPYLSEDECLELFEFMEAKELHQQRMRCEAFEGNTRRERRVRIDPVVRRLAAVAGAEWSVANILNEVLPEQINLSNARHLLDPRLPHIKSLEGKPPPNFEDKSKRIRSVVPIQTVPCVPDVPITSHPAKTTHAQLLSSRFRGHILSIWEDKFRLKCLAVEDALFLLAQPTVACTLESASFLREVHLSYDQVLELEMALTMLHRQKELTHFHSPKRSSGTSKSTVPLCSMLVRNTWNYGQTFSVSRSLPEVVTFKRLASPSLPQATTPLSSIRMRSKYANKVHNKGYDDTRLSIKQIKGSSGLQFGAANGAGQELCPRSIRDWVRDHCVEEVRSVTIRKNFAAENFSIALSKHWHRVKRQRFSRWHQQMLWIRCDEQVRRFCKLKCALWALQRSRKRLESLVFRLWTRWMVDTSHQRELESIAAAVAIQSCVRGVRGKRLAAVYHLHQAAALIQARWRGIYCRKMAQRKKRFVAYNAAARRVQRCYHSYIFRVRFDAWMRYQRAARVITRTLKRYIEQKRDFLAWCHHLARYHAVIRIQIWTRRTISRIQHAKSNRDRIAKARQIVFNFLRRARFLQCFGLRMDQAQKRKTAAAVQLQNAYRAKQARARFYELKVRLEDQRRQEILTAMWDNAYATSIQKWWRKRKARQRRPRGAS